MGVGCSSGSESFVEKPGPNGLYPTAAFIWMGSGGCRSSEKSPAREGCSVKGVIEWEPGEDHHEPRSWGREVRVLSLGGTWTEEAITGHQRDEAESSTSCNSVLLIIFLLSLYILISVFNFFLSLFL